MGKYHAYPEYKESGVEWLGSIPADWSVRRVQETALVISGYPFESKKFDPLVGIPLIRIRDIKAQKTEVFFNGEVPKEALVDSGDVLVGMDGDFNVAMWKSGLAALNQRVACLRADDKHLQKFLFYVLPFNMKVVNDLTYFTTVKHLSNNDILKTVYALPERVELINIVNFLDHETAKIDTLIEKQQQLIKLLKEKRQAVISHAVTKGLNPEAPMKDSGVEWLGEVPEHWGVSRIKYLSSIISKGTTPSTIGGDFVTEGVRFLKAENIGKSTSVKPFPEFFISEKVDTQLSRSRLKENDVLVIIAGATTGLASIVQKDVLPANTNQAVSFIRPVNPKLSYWIVNWLTTEFVQSTIWMGAVQAAQPNLSMEDLGNIPIVVPPESELVLIQESLKGKLATLDNLMIKAESAISIMQERRTALISAAVTGKIDVRNWQAPTSQNQALEQTA
ncbi:restriction endonuclease subunit S [Vibrio fluvialis]